MPYIPNDTFNTACAVDLLTYFQRTRPQDLKKRGSEYCLSYHDSLRMSNGKWNWHARGIGGKSAVDWLTRTQGYTVADAVREVMGAGLSPAVCTPDAKEPPRQTKETFILPSKHADHRRVFAYLCSRGLDAEIINHHMKANRLYESSDLHNAVFVGFDEKNTARYALQRGTLSDKRFLGEVSGSDKRYAFRAIYETDTAYLRLYESPIDLLSFQCLQKLAHKPWKKGAYLSLGGISKKITVLPSALATHLKCHPETSRIDFHFDADDTGREAARAIYEILKTDYPHITCKNYTSRVGKDMNDWLVKVMETRKHERAKTQETAR